MRKEKQRFAFVFAAAALLLAGCAQFERQTAAPVDAVDDDTYCRANGVAPGSAAYVACRKDRDVASSRAASGGSGIERAHRNLAEDMLNNKR
jgi:hypothetical protein